MGTPLTGSTVASTYSGLLKTSDNATITSSLKTLCDGGGVDSPLQISTSAINSTGDFSVATNKFSVLSASGNTSVAGTLAVTGAATLSSSLGVTGAATLSSTLGVTGATTLSNTLLVTGAATLQSTLSVSSNISTSGGNLSVYGNIVQSNAAATNTIAGSLSVGTSTTLSSLTCNGLATFNAGISVPTSVTFGGTVTISGATQINNTLNVTNTIAATGTISTSGNLTATGNLTINGNSTLGDAAADLLTIRANTVTLPNATTVTVDAASDKIVILDASDSSRLRVVDASSVIPGASNMPQCVQTHFASINQFNGSSTGSGEEITDLTTTITPRSSSSKVLITVMINYCSINGSYGAFRLTRNGTEIGSNSIGSSLYGIAGVAENELTTEVANRYIQFLDTPSTGSAVTYKLHLYTTGFGGTIPTVYLNRTEADVTSPPNAQNKARGSSNMVLTEFFA